VATKTSFAVNLLLGVGICLGMAGSLAAQPALTVTLSGTLGPYLSGSGEITNGGKYASGTITASGPSGRDYCLITYTGGTTPGTGKVYFAGTGAGNNITVPFQTIGTSGIESPGSGYNFFSPPSAGTAATGSTGTTCTGSSIGITGVGIDDPLGLNNASFTGTTTINPVGISFGENPIPASLSLTVPSLGTVTCSAQVSVTASGSGDVVMTKCTFAAAGGTAFSSTVNLPGGTFPAAVPMAFATTNLTAGSTTTYTPGPASTYNGDTTELGITTSSMIGASCSGSGATACPSETLNPGTLSFSAVAGGASPATQNVTVNTSPQENESFSVSTSASWLTANPTGGDMGSAGLPVAIGTNITGLAVGTYTGYVCVYTAASNSTASTCSASASTPVVTVTLMVSPQSFTLTPTPASFTFTSVNSTATQSQNLSVSASTGAQVPFTAVASSTGNWLSVPSGGTTGGAAIAVTVDPTKVAGPGTYSGTITLNATGATQAVIVPVSFTVTTVSTSTVLNFSGIVNGANPASQQFLVTATGNVDLAFTASAGTSSGGPWLSVTSSGTTNVTELTVSVNTAGLSAPTYNGTISITPTGGTPIQVATVSLALSSLPSMQVQAGTSLPLTFAYTPGSSPSQPLVITSSSSTAISYTASTSVTSSGGNWLSVGPSSNSTGATETVSIVTGVASTLPNGSYTGSVIFTCTTGTCANAGGTLTVPVTMTVTATLTPSPTSVTFNYTIGNNTTLTPISIGTSSNGQPITFTAAATSTSPNGAWLTIAPSGSITTPNGVMASVTGSALTNLAAGTYTGNIAFTSTGATVSPVNIPATLVVSSALQTNPGSLAFAFQTGGTPPSSQTLSVTSNGAPLSITAAASGTSNSITWLSVSPLSGTTPQTLTVSVTPAGLPTGPYNGTITVSSGQAGNSPLTIPVSLSVSASPSLTATPSSLSANYTVGGTIPVLPTVTIGSSGTALSNVSVGAPTVPWLSVSQNGTTTPNVTLTVSLVSASLPTTAGTVSGSFTINATGAAAPLTYTVTLNVSAQPALTVGPTRLSFTGQVNGANPAAQTLTVDSTNGSVNFTAVPTSVGNWLSVTPSGSTNATLQVTVNTAGLAVGSNYTGSILITASGASGSPVTIPVSLSVTSIPNLIVVPTTLSFSYTSGGAAPTGMSVAVSTSNSTSTAFSLSASTVSGGSWLQVPASGSAPGSFMANIATGNLTASGTLTGTITVSAAGYTSATVAVTLVVTQPKAVIQVTGNTGFTLANTSAPATSTLAVSASDGSAQAFTIAAGASQYNWLTLSPTSGTTPATVTLTANPAGLVPGIYLIPVTVTMPALPVPTKTIQAQLTITGSNLAASPNMLTFNYQPALPFPAAQTVSLTTITGGTVALASVTSDVGWLIVTSAASAPATLQVSINPGLLAVGTYTGDILVKGVGSPNTSLDIPVTLTVGSSPKLTSTPSSLSFNYQIGGAAPAPQSFAVSVSGNLQVNYTATSPGSWLQVSPPTGTTPGSVLVTANPAGLAAGTYGGTINVTAPGAANAAPVAVTLTVSGAPQISVAPSQLIFIAPTGGSAPAPQTLTLTSGSPLAFTAAPGSAWLSVTPTSGTTPATLTVSASAAGLATGVYNGTINITPAGSAVPQLILVTLQVGNVTPSITAVINAASGAAGSVAPGMAVTIFGALLGPATGVPWAGVPPDGGTAATSLGGTQVLFDGAPVPLLYSASGQVNAMVPFELTGKASTVLQVVYNGATSLGTTLPIVAAEPGLFTANASGTGQGSILNENFQVNSTASPAAAGSAIMLFGTGGGVTVPPSVDGTLNPITAPGAPLGALALTATATIGGQAATVLYAGPAPGLVAGIFQINLTIPSGTPSGSAPVVVTLTCETPGQANCISASSQTVTVAVQ
jgi:uncharacterized protein (TIGR03437 family)